MYKNIHYVALQTEPSIDPACLEIAVSPDQQFQVVQKFEDKEIIVLDDTVTDAKGSIRQVYQVEVHGSKSPFVIQFKFIASGGGQLLGVLHQISATIGACTTPGKSSRTFVINIFNI